MATVIEYGLVAGFLAMIGSLAFTIATDDTKSEKPGGHQASVQSVKSPEAPSYKADGPEVFYHVAKKWEVSHTFGPDRKFLLKDPLDGIKIVDVTRKNYDSIGEGSNICVDSKGNIHVTQASSCKHTPAE